MTTLDQCLAPATPAELRLCLQVARHVHMARLMASMSNRLAPAVATIDLHTHLRAGVEGQAVTSREVSAAIARLVIEGLLAPANVAGTPAVTWKGAL
jgi:hypothetical protein